MAISGVENKNFITQSIPSAHVSATPRISAKDTITQCSSSQKNTDGCFMGMFKAIGRFFVRFFTVIKHICCCIPFPGSARRFCSTEFVKKFLVDGGNFDVFEDHDEVIVGRFLLRKKDKSCEFYIQLKKEGKYIVQLEEIKDLKLAAQHITYGIPIICPHENRDAKSVLKELSLSEKYTGRINGDVFELIAKNPPEVILLQVEEKVMDLEDYTCTCLFSIPGKGKDAEVILGNHSENSREFGLFNIENYPEVIPSFVEMFKQKSLNFLKENDKINVGLLSKNPALHNKLEENGFKSADKNDSSVDFMYFDVP